MKEFPYKAVFSDAKYCVVKPLVSEAKDKMLAIASLQQIGKFIPNIDTIKNADLLPVAFNACVVNRVNKNGDVIDTPTAIATYKEFINKPINLEHHRQQVIGVILNVGFSAFGSDQPLLENDVAKMNAPFNIVLGGVVWRIVSPDIADFIEESNDPTSDHYLGISASWELGFSDYDIAVLPAGVKNLADAKIITNPTEIEALKKYLRALGGDGKYDDNFYYRKPKDVLPLGIGFTEKPAAEVKGIAAEVKKTVNEPEKPAFAECEASEHHKEICLCGTVISQCRCMSETKKITTVQDGCEVCKNKLAAAAIESTNKISQSKNTNVKRERIDIMKLSSITDLNDENLKEAKASEIAQFVSEQLKKGNDTWLAEKNNLNDQLTKANTESTKIIKEHAELTATVTQLKATVESLNKEKSDREAVDKFNARMSEVNEAYELDDEVRAALVDEVKAIASDEDFDKWKKKATVLLKGFAKKKAKNDNDQDDTGKNSNQDSGAKKKSKADDMDDSDSDAKKKAKAAEAIAALEEQLDKAKKEAGLPNSSDAAPKTLVEKYSQAFAKENFVIKL